MHDESRKSVAAPTVALTPDELRIVRSVTDRVIPGAQVFVFGSRAVGRNRPFSDLDLLVVRQERLTWTELAELDDLFDASKLPFRVDVVEASGLVGGFAQRVLGERVPLADL